MVHDRSSSSQAKASWSHWTHRSAWNSDNVRRSGCRGSNAGALGFNWELPQLCTVKPAWGAACISWLRWSDDFFVVVCRCFCMRENTSVSVGTCCMLEMVMTMLSPSCSWTRSIGPRWISPACNLHLRRLHHLAMPRSSKIVSWPT